MTLKQICVDHYYHFALGLVTKGLRKEENEIWDKILLLSAMLEYGRLSFNGHLYMTDVSVKRTLELVPAFLYSLYLTLYKTDTSLNRTLIAGPKGVPFRES